MASSFPKLKNLSLTLVFQILIVLALLYGLYYFMTQSNMVKIEKSGMSSMEQNAQSSPAPVDQTSMIAPAASSEYNEAAALTGSDLLPNDVNSEWNNLNLERAKNGVVMPDMLQAGVHQGLDTVGTVLRNANQQLRPDPPIPKSSQGLCNVNMSTIDPPVPISQT